MTERPALSIALVLNLDLAIIELAMGLIAKRVVHLIDAADFFQDSPIYSAAPDGTGRGLGDWHLDIPSDQNP